MYAVSDYTSGYHFPPSLLSAQRFLYFVQMSDVTKHEYLVATPPSAFYGAQRSPFRFRTAAFRNETVVYTTVFIQVNGKG